MMAEASDGHRTADPEPGSVLALIHEGWGQLKRQRPLAAWAAWQRALRLEPGSKAATHALDVLAQAPDLPDAARLDYRFLTPLDDDQRRRWDAVLRSRDLGDLRDAASAFASLADAAGDGRARYNQGLCLAWLGRNAEAVAALGDAVALLAEPELGVAVDAAALAEVVRQGAGAEALADDLSHVAILHAVDPAAGEADPLHPGNFLDDRADVRLVPLPLDPGTGRPARADARLFEWLDRADRPTARGAMPEVARLRATALRAPGLLRLSGPDPVLLLGAADEAVRRAGDRLGRVDRAATPLPLAFLDAAVWAIRVPPGTGPDAADALNRAAVEAFYETAWINRPRHGLGGRTPLEAGRLAQAGDLVAGAQLAGVIRVREQLGARPLTARLYQGYPFDRLRRRVGLPPVDPDAVDAADPSAMGPSELDALDPKALDPLALAEAFESAAALGDDERTARFAAWLADLDLDRAAPAWRRIDRPAVFATLVRVALAEDDADLALEWLDRAAVVDRAVGGGTDAAKFLTWRAEVQARAGRPDAALLTYQQILADRPDPVVALDAAETMLDNGAEDSARVLARVALTLALRDGDDALAERAEALL